LPSEEEWQTLVDFAGGNEIAGKKLKARSGWNSYWGKSGNGTDILGFSALPGGDGSSNGSFAGVGYYGGWWTATKGGASVAYYRYMNYNYAHVYSYFNDKTDFYSVRCVQDSP